MRNSRTGDESAEHARIERLWQRRELAVLALLSVLALFLFSDSSWDLAAARLFYHPDHAADPWFEQNRPLWNFLYLSAPWLTGFALLGSIGLQLGALLRESLRRYRRGAVYTFLVVALGPGLIVNAVCKPYWGRPRPREVVELGGNAAYRPFYAPAVGSPGKSFPCGHCSIVFAFGAGWWLLRARRARYAAAILAFVVVSGALMGAARMAAGGHFLSDVVWAGLIVLWVCYWLHYHVMNADWAGLTRLDQIFADRRGLALIFYGGLGVVAIVTVLVASPFHNEIRLDAPVTASSGIAFEPVRLEVDHARVDLVVDSAFEAPFRVVGYAKGFGFPGGKTLAGCQNEVQYDGQNDGQKVMNCHIRRRGFFTDYESVVRVTVNPSRLSKLKILLKQSELVRVDPSAELPATISIVK